MREKMKLAVDLLLYYQNHEEIQEDKPTRSE